MNWVRAWLLIGFDVFAVVGRRAARDKVRSHRMRRVVLRHRARRIRCERALGHQPPVYSQSQKLLKRVCDQMKDC